AMTAFNSAHAATSSRNRSPMDRRRSAFAGSRWVCNPATSVNATPLAHATFERILRNTHRLSAVCPVVAARCRRGEQAQMNRFLRWLVIGLVAGAAGLAHAAGGSGGGGGGGADGSKKQDASYLAGVQAIERQDWKKAIALFQTS